MKKNTKYGLLGLCVLAMIVMPVLGFSGMVTSYVGWFVMGNISAIAIVTSAFLVQSIETGMDLMFVNADWAKKVRKGTK